VGPPFFFASLDGRRREGLAAPSRRSPEFTGVRYLCNRSSALHLRRKALTEFRESATPGTQRRDFSRLFPRPCPGTIADRVSTEVPFLRHFSVTAGGIKTYPAPARKMLSADPVWANTGCVLAGPLSPKLTVRHKI